MTGWRLCIFAGQPDRPVYIAQGRVAHFVFVLLLHDRPQISSNWGREKAGGLGIAVGCGGLYRASLSTQEPMLL